MSDAGFLVFVAQVPFMMLYVLVRRLAEFPIERERRKDVDISRGEWVLIIGIIGVLVGVAVIDLVGTLLVGAWMLGLIEWHNVVVVPIGHAGLLALIFCVMLMRHVAFVRGQRSHGSFLCSV